MEPSSKIVIVLILVSVVSLLAYLVKVGLISLYLFRQTSRTLLEDVLHVIVILEPVLIALKSSLIVTYYVAYRAMMLSASTKITMLEVVQLITTLSAVAVFACIAFKNVDDLSKITIGVVAVWLCSTFTLYGTIIVTTRIFIPDYR